jgi:hypothetical protein
VPRTSSPPPVERSEPRVDGRRGRGRRRSAERPSPPSG